MLWFDSCTASANTSILSHDIDWLIDWWLEQWIDFNGIILSKVLYRMGEFYSMSAATCDRPEPVQFPEKDTRGQQGLIFVPSRLQEAKTALGKPSSLQNQWLPASPWGIPKHPPGKKSAPCLSFGGKSNLTECTFPKSPLGITNPNVKQGLYFTGILLGVLRGVREAPPCTGLNTSEMPNQSGASKVDQVLQNQSLLWSVSWVTKS